jgi:hypothetical protein
MIDRLIADALVVAHTLFVLFVVLGSFLVIRWRWLAWFHVPTAVWGAVIEFAGWVCPLTPLEKEFRRRAGEGGYEGGFVEHYLLGWLYPEGLTRETQIWLGIGVIVINAIGYSLAVMRWRRSASRGASGGDVSPR